MAILGSMGYEKVNQSIERVSLERVLPRSFAPSRRAFVGSTQLVPNFVKGRQKHRDMSRREVSYVIVTGAIECLKEQGNFSKSGKTYVTRTT